MSETSLITDIKSIVSSYIQNFSIDIVERKPKTASSMSVALAVVFQDNSITQDLIRDLIEYKVQQDYNDVDFETSKDINDLSAEIILVYAEIFYIT